ncbi:macro domain-containing protein [Nonomuraea sp. NPDC046802]|uniref:macro domain-containing protein n=1 Tax=Nonomuraea sp. NPDC046802 TaxID=3154919 RepID=UPI003403EE91
MSDIRYVVGDATDPAGTGVRIVAHICNDTGGWGRGFVLARSRRWRQPEAEYRRWHRGRAANDFGLGALQIVPVHPDVRVANMVAQHGIRSAARPTAVPLRYDALAQCLTALAEHAVRLKASVHLPRIGTGLAGGTWDRIEPLIQQHLADREISVTVYDLS